MTPERRLEIFSKEVLTFSELGELLCVSNSTARKILTEIKTKNDRLGIATILHIQDYIDYYNLDIRRYLMPKKERLYEIKESCYSDIQEDG